MIIISNDIVEVVVVVVVEVVDTARFLKTTLFLNKVVLWLTLRYSSSNINVIVNGIDFVCLKLVFQIEWREVSS